MQPRLIRLRDAPNYLGMDKNRFNKEVKPYLSIIPTTRQGENEVRSRGARDRRALTGEAGNASRRKVIVGDAGTNPEG
jgi:hypothetical protein